MPLSADVTICLIPPCPLPMPDEGTAGSEEMTPIARVTAAEILGLI